MEVRDFTLEVRDVNLIRRGQITPEYVDLRAEPQYVGVGGWTVRLPADHPMAGWLRLPGSGIVITHRDPEVGVLLSGPRRQPTEAADRDDPTGTLTVQGVTDNVVLWNRLAYPAPSTADVSAQGAAYDVRTGPAESVMRAYVDANAGPLAPVARRIAGLTLSPDLARGVTVTRSARFDVLGDFLAEVAQFAGLGFRVVQVGQHLEFQVDDPADRSALVRLDLWNGTLASQVVTDSPPSITRAIVAGQGRGDARTFLERGAPDAEAAWGVWGRVERFLDQRNTDDPVELQQAGDKALLDGAASASITAVPGDDQTMRWPQDWGLGDTIAVVANGDESVAQVTSVTVLANKNGVRVGAGIGELAAWTPTAHVERAQEAANARISALERNAEVDNRGGRLAGEIMAWAGIGIPPGWLVCDGTPVSRTTYADLFAAIGTAYGGGNGSTTFSLPDFRGRVIVGQDPAQVEFDVVGDSGGAKVHTLTVPEMPSHTHNIAAVGGGITPAVVGANESGAATANRYHLANGTAAFAAVANGGGGAHNNLQPFRVARYLIRT